MRVCQGHILRAETFPACGHAPPTPLVLLPIGNMPTILFKNAHNINTPYKHVHSTVNRPQRRSKRTCLPKSRSDGHILQGHVPPTKQPRKRHEGHTYKGHIPTNTFGLTHLYRRFFGRLTSTTRSLGSRAHPPHFLFLQCRNLIERRPLTCFKDLRGCRIASLMPMLERRKKNQRDT